MNVFIYLLEGLLAFFTTFGAEILFLGMLLVFGILVTGVLAPLGALSWWAGWSKNSGHARTQNPPIPAAHETLDTEAQTLAPNETQPTLHYIVYLSGIGEVSTKFPHQMEVAYLKALQTALPEAHMIDDIFAFSVTNVGLTEERFMGGFWRWMKDVKTKPGKHAILGQIAINGRNALQVGVSADYRYGPVFNYGAASSMFHSLLEAGFTPASGAVVTLLGYSGGGQVVLGAAQFLKAAINSPLQVISLAGVLSDNPGIDAADEIVHLTGQHDPIQAIGGYLFPRRWPIARASRWNQAIARGKLHLIDMGPMRHNGSEGYLDPQAVLDDGRSYLDTTVAQTVQVIHAFQARYLEKSDA